MDAKGETGPRGIGQYAETALHQALKELYAAEPGARLEEPACGKVVDVLTPKGFVEVQTRNLGAICPKVQMLACNGPVRLVHPIPVVTTIRRLDPAGGEAAPDRRSNARRDLYSLFDELVHAPGLVAWPNVRVEVLLVRVLELRVRDGTGSWRRRGDRVLSRALEEVIRTVSLETPADWLALLPAGSGDSWDSLSLGQALGISPIRARKMLYTYCRAGLLREAGLRGKRKTYVRGSSAS